MTSRISLRKLIKTDCVQRSWLAVVMFVACGLLLPVGLLMRLQAAAAVYPGVPAVNAQAAQELLMMKRALVTQVLGSGNYLIGAGVVVAAMLAAFSGFAYLHSRSRVDFFHSIAVRREKLFFVPFIAGALLTVVPYVLCVLASALIAAGSGAMTGAIAGEILCTAGIFVLSFFAVYALLVLGMMLAGRMVSGVLLGFLFIGYGPLCWYLTQGLFSLSFQTYWGPSVPASAGLVLSPASLLLRIMRTGAYGGSIPAWMLLLQAAFLAAGVVLSLFFYRRRPSEAAESALIHPRMHAFVKAVITVPAAMLVGMMFFLAQGSLVWLLTGSLIGAFLINWALDAVFDWDVKGILSHKISGGIVIGLTAAILIFLVADPIGFDRWVPEADQVEAASLWTWQGVPESGNYYFTSDAGTQEMLEASLCENTAPVLALAEEGAANVDRFHRDVPYVVDYAVPYEEADSRTDAVVCFKMKNGSLKFRQYSVRSRSADDAMAALSESAAWRSEVYSTAFISADDFSNGTVMSTTDLLLGEGTDLDLTTREQREIAELLVREGSSLTVAEMSAAEPVGCIELNIPYEEGREAVVNRIMLYPQFEKTLRFLAEKGFDLPDAPDTEAVAEKITALNVYGLTDLNMGAEWFAIREKEDIRAFLSAVRLSYTGEAEGEHRVALEFERQDSIYNSFTAQLLDEELYKELLEKYAE